MKKLRRNISIGKMAALILLLLLGVIASPASRVSAADNYTVKVTGRMLRSQVSPFLELLNAERTKAGLPEMQLDEKAMELAELRAAQSSLDLTVYRTEDLDGKDSFEGIPLVPGTFVCDVPTLYTPDDSGIDKRETLGSDTFDFYYNEAEMTKIPINEEGITLKDALLDGKTTRVGIAFYCGDPDECQCVAIDLCLMRETGEERLTPYTGELTADENETFAFQAPAKVVQFSPDEGTTKLAIGKEQQLRPFYRSFSYDSENDDWEVTDGGFYFDSDCGTWISSDEDVAEVTSDGIVTGVGPGTAEISFLLNDNEAIKYTCTVQVPLGQGKIKSLKSPKRKRLQVTYNKVAGADGYQVYVSVSSKFSTKKVLTTKKLKLTTSTRKRCRYYYAKVRAYYIDKNGKKVYGKFSSVKKVRVK